MRVCSLFAGIGGFDEAFRRCGHQIVYANEWDKYAAKIYEKNFGAKPDTRDITKVPSAEIPEHDIICGGFPCQSFSIAGKRLGFADTRGTLFREIMRIAEYHRTPYLLLENVKGLLSHDEGRTFAVILATMDELGYDISWQVLNSKDFGVPQNRERVFIFARRKDAKPFNIFPIINDNEQYVEQFKRKENVYLVQTDISERFKELLLCIPQEEEKEISREQMQEMFSEISKGIQKGTCRKIPRETEGMDTNSERGLQIIEEFNSWASSQDFSREVCGVVQIPTEDLLLLWLKARISENCEGQIQQQDIPFISRQNKFINGLRRWEFGVVLFALQSYQRRLFFSIGNGRDWKKIYSTEVEKVCYNKTLSSILEENPDQKYFLSKKVLKAMKERTEKNLKENRMFQPLIVDMGSGGQRRPMFFPKKEKEEKKK